MIVSCYQNIYQKASLLLWLCPIVMTCAFSEEKGNCDVFTINGKLNYCFKIYKNSHDDLYKIIKKTDLLSIDQSNKINRKDILDTPMDKSRVLATYIELIKPKNSTFIQSFDENTLLYGWWKHHADKKTNNITKNYKKELKRINHMKKTYKEKSQWTIRDFSIDPYSFEDSPDSTENNRQHHEK